MSGLLSKFAPTAVVAAVVAWCCWPYLIDSDSELGLDENPSVPVIASALLSPTFAPPPDRDAFMLGDAGNRRLNAETAFSALGKFVSLLASQGPVPVGTDQAPAPEASLHEQVANLSLKATYCQGDRRVALIGDQLFEQGDSIALPQPLSDPCVVSQISAHRVLLRRKGQPVELSFRDPIAPAVVPETSGNGCNSSQKSGLPRETTSHVNPNRKPL